MAKRWELRLSGDDEMPALWMIVERNGKRAYDSLVAAIHVDCIPDCVVPNKLRPSVRIKITEDTDSDS